MFHRDTPSSQQDQEKTSRRNYLIYAGITIVAVAGSGAVLWKRQQPNLLTNQPLTTSLPQEHTSQSFSSSTEVTMGTSPAKLVQDSSNVSVVQSNTSLDIDALVQQSVKLVGGIEKIVSPGNIVVIKPAVLSSDSNCAPHPQVVKAIIRLVKEAGGQAIVAESSSSGNATYNLEKIGITTIAHEEGIEVVDLQTEKEIEIQIPNGVELKKVKTYPTILNSDVLISVPKLKRHNSANVTISLKNMMGTLPRSEMLNFHRINLSQCIADLNTVLKPHLAIIDAISVMTRTGPTGGDMVTLNTVIASTDPVAADRIAAQQLQDLEEQIELSSRHRFNAAEVKHIRNAADLKIGINNLSRINVITQTLT